MARVLRAAQGLVFRFTEFRISNCELRNGRVATAFKIRNPQSKILSRSIEVNASVSAVLQASRGSNSAEVCHVLIGVEQGDLVRYPFKAADDLPEHFEGHLEIPFGNMGGPLPTTPGSFVIAANALMQIGDLLKEATLWLCYAVGETNLQGLNFEQIQIHENQITFLIKKVL